MAGFNFEIPSDLIRILEKLENTEVITEEALKEAEPILKAAVKKRVAEHKETGDMLRSIESTGVSHNSYGAYICVRPTGKDSKGVRNMEKLAHLEYGYIEPNGKAFVAPRPIITKAVNESQKKIIDKMRFVLEKRIKR